MIFIAILFDIKPSPIFIFVLVSNRQLLTCSLIGNIFQAVKMSQILGQCHHIGWVELRFGAFQDSVIFLYYIFERIS